MIVEPWVTGAETTEARQVSTPVQRAALPQPEKIVVMQLSDRVPWSSVVVEPRTAGADARPTCAG